TVARLLCSPEFISHNRHTTSLHQSDFENLLHAGDVAGILLVEALHTSTEYRRMSDHCDLHSGKIEIQSEFLRAITLRGTIKARHKLPDEAKLRRILETYFFRHRFARSVARELGIAR